MTELYLVRHGQTDWNINCKCQGVTNIPLNQVGINQANTLANILVNKGLTFDVFVSSNLSRAITTCQIIKDKLNDKSNIIIEKEITERNFGELEGKSFEFVGKVFDKNLQNTYKGFETNQELVKRSVECVKRIALAHQDKKILIVSHSNTIKALANYVDSSKYNFGTKIPNLNVSKFVYSDDLYLENLYFIEGLGEDKTKMSK